MNTRGKVANLIYDFLDPDKDCETVEAILEELFEKFDVEEKPEEK